MSYPNPNYNPGFPQNNFNFIPWSQTAPHLFNMGLFNPLSSQYLNHLSQQNPLLINQQNHFYSSNFSLNSPTISNPISNTQQFNHPNYVPNKDFNVLKKASHPLKSQTRIPEIITIDDDSPEPYRTPAMAVIKEKSTVKINSNVIDTNKRVISNEYQK
jgi:hypothetical protein